MTMRMPRCTWTLKPRNPARLSRATNSAAVARCWSAGSGGGGGLFAVAPAPSPPGPPGDTPGPPGDTPGPPGDTPGPVGGDGGNGGNDAPAGGASGAGDGDGGGEGNAPAGRSSSPGVSDGDIGSYSAWPVASTRSPPGGRQLIVGRMTARLVVLVSGSGTNLQALIGACADPSYGAAVAAVGADRPGTGGLARAERAGIPTFVHRVVDYPDRAAWDRALAASVAGFDPDLVISAGFMKLVGPAFLNRFEGRFINTHPALLPAFSGMHGVRDALDYGVKVTGCTVFMVDAGTDTGPVIAQAVVGVRDDDDVATLHERVKVAERALLVDTVGAMVRGGWSVQDRKVKVGR